MNEKLVISIFSDLVCPWCYIGKSRLYKAIEQLEARDKIEIHFKAYQLYPNPTKSESQRRGSPRPSKKLSSLIIETAKTEGLEIETKKIQKIPDTFEAHRLLSIGGGKQSELAEELFQSFFNYGMDLESKTELIKIGERSGLDKETLKQFKDDESYGKALVEDFFTEARNLAISAVPTFQLPNKSVISGAIETDKWISFFRKRFGL